MEAASCLKTLLGCRAIWDCPEGRLGTVVMVGSSLGAWHPSGGGLELSWVW